MSAKFPRGGGGGAGPFLARSLLNVILNLGYNMAIMRQSACLVVNPITVKTRKISRGLYFREASHMRSLVQMKSSRNGEITLSFTDISESYPSHEF